MFKIKEPERFELVNIDPNDISLFIPEIEAYFRIKFYDEELRRIFTFGNLCDLIINKLEEKETNDCTKQQAFYRIRKALIEGQLFDKNMLSPNTSLEDIFPLKQRHQLIEKFETHLGFKVQLLEPGKGWPLFIFRLTFLVSLVTLFCSIPVGLSGLVLSVAAIELAKMPRNELAIKTIRELAEKITNENYNHIRQAPSAVNQKAVVLKVKDLFKKKFDLDDDALRRDTVF
ncbi:hypothetical protein [Chitinophaga sp.]|uniref:hypothetical protein n=1 Tax=Chitinophaga sp. TaxID=1869181 RepID=UPI0031E0083B